MLQSRSSEITSATTLADFLAPRFTCRRLAGGAALFDCQNWATHVLSPASVAILEILTESRVACRPSLNEAHAIVRAALSASDEALDEETERQILLTLRQLRHIGVLD